MSKIAIKAENISKAYQLGEFSTGTLSRDIERWWGNIRGKEDTFLKIGETNDRTSKGSSDIVWSLKDINFEILQGDAIGIIGRNGAGKSTLLKVLSRVTTPTTGNIKVKGRIASLLEVGTGFHPELTGRENIYLNGAILGMRKWEIKKHFDAIVEFAGVERYIDTPVKRYSSGMYVRLAFAVAAHLESEILIVDEVLAVGDAEFQKKCLGKMGEVSQGEGRTVLFVSHNMNAVTTLCNKGILLSNGIVELVASSAECINVYNAYDRNNAQVTFWANTNEKYYDEAFAIKSVQLLNEDLQPLSRNTISTQDTLNIMFEGEIIEIDGLLKVGYELLTDDGLLVFTSLTTDSTPEHWPKMYPGINKIVSKIPVQYLAPGNYIISVHISLHNIKWICNSKQQDVKLNFIMLPSNQLSPYFEESGSVLIGSKYTNVT